MRIFSQCQRETRSGERSFLPSHSNHQRQGNYTSPIQRTAKVRPVCSVTNLTIFLFAINFLWAIFHLHIGLLGLTSSGAGGVEVEGGTVRDGHFPYQTSNSGPGSVKSGEPPGYASRPPRIDVPALLLPHIFNSASGLAKETGGYIPKLSFCSSMMNRFWQMEEAFPINVETMRPFAPAVEFTLVVFGENQDLVAKWVYERYAADLANGWLKVFTSDGLANFHASIAKNTAHRQATGSFLMNLDIDSTCDRLVLLYGLLILLCFQHSIFCHFPSSFPFSPFFA